MNLQLKIVLKKKHPQTIFELHRKDNSLTFSKIQSGMEFHEIGHWAVESTLEIDDAFFGIINQGYTIEDFEKPRDQRPKELMPTNLSSSSIFVEHYVNLLMTELNSGIIPTFFEQLVAICKSKGVEVPILFDREKVDRIRTLYLQQVKLWQELGHEKELVLWI